MRLKQVQTVGEEEEEREKKMLDNRNWKIDEPRLHVLHVAHKQVYLFISSLYKEAHISLVSCALINLVLFFFPSSLLFEKICTGFVFFVFFLNGVWDVLIIVLEEKFFLCFYESLSYCFFSYYWNMFTISCGDFTFLACVWMRKQQQKREKRIWKSVNVLNQIKDDIPSSRISALEVQRPVRNTFVMLSEHGMSAPL